MIVENLSDLKPGQRVRVTYEANIVKVSQANPDATDWLVLDGFGDDRNYWLPADTPTLRVEAIEPDYEHYGIYQDAEGAIWSFDRHYYGPEGRAWFSPGSAEAYDFDVPERPLVKLVPEARSA